jgi:HSP20 family molecular chaperone IbpA
MSSRMPADPDALRRQLAVLFGQEGFLPPVDVYTTSDPPTLHVRMEIAGVDPEQVAIRLEGRALTIEGERPPGHDSRVGYQHMEIPYGHFERRVELPVDVDGSRGGASYRAGFLTVSLPIAVRRSPRRVIVRVVL